MKKLFASLLMIAATVSAFALDYTAKATLTLKNASGDECMMTIAQSDAASIADYCAEMKMDYRDIAFYALNGGKKYEIFAANALGTQAFGLKTNADTKYTITVSNVSGTETLYLYDEVAKDGIELKEGAVYSFEATADADDRFHLAATPATPAICHQNGRLEITAYQGASVKVLAYDDESEVIAATAITAAYQEIDLATLAAGQYIVVLTTADGDQRLVIKK